MTKVAIITGAGRGIGAATAHLAAERGYHVCVNYVTNKEAAKAVVGGIERNGGKAIAVAADTSSEADVTHLFNTVDKELGPLDALVNNAAILKPQTRLEYMEADRLRDLFAVNIIGYFLCAREAVRRMSTKNGGNGGAIVNVSSVAAKLGSPGEYVDYAASKGAVDTLTIGLSREVAEEGVRVNGVRPGYIYTDIHADGGVPDRVDRIKNQIPLKRGGQPVEVANAIMWLLSDEASYTTGTFINTAGGR